jgi:DNA mismatch endonuclease (patch repair protein)
MARRNHRVNSMLRPMDNLSPKERRKAMRAVKGRDTTPERLAALALRAVGVRYRRQARFLPGRPDFVLPDLRAALFVQGCFWHGHGCRSRIPRTNRAYWLTKLARNRRRDRRVRRILNRLGWTVVVLWECRIAAADAAATAVRRAVARASAPTATGLRHLPTLSARRVPRMTARPEPLGRTQLHVKSITRDAGIRYWW